MDLVERARRFLAKMEPSISGSNGHNALLKAAGVLVQGFDFDDSTAISLLTSDFNPRCDPPWNHRDLERKVSEARRLGKNQPVGYLIGRQGKSGSTDRPAASVTSEPKREKKYQDFDANALRAMMVTGFKPSWKWLAERSPIDPRDVTPQAFLDTIFEPGEAALVFLNFTSQGEIGHIAGAPGQSFQLGMRPNAARKKIEQFPLSSRVGAWFLPLPLDGKWYPTGRADRNGDPVLSRRSGRSVKTYRHLLLESDDADESEWLNLLCQLPLPISALYTSGGRSVHALVRIDTDSKSQFDAFRDRIIPLLSRLGADPAAMSGVRLTRLPGVLREGTEHDGRYVRYDKPRLQRLLYLNPRPEVAPLKLMQRLREIDTL